MKIRLALLEKDKDYLSRITSVFQNNYADLLEVYSFTDPKAAFSILQTAKIDVFITDESLAVEPDLVPKRCAFAYFTGITGQKTINGIPAINKYQKHSMIYKEILNVLSDKNITVSGLYKSNNSNTKIISFTAPGGGAGATTASIACAMILADKGIKTLYLDLEQLGDPDLRLESQGQFDLGDVIYTVKSRKSNLRIKLDSTVRQDRSGVYYYSACKSALDMMELSEDDITIILDELISSESYDYIIIDTDNRIDPVFQKIAKQTDKMIIVSDGSDVSIQKSKRFINALDLAGQNEGINHSDKIYVLYNKFSSKAGRHIESADLKILGGVPIFKGASFEQMVSQVKELRIFDSLVSESEDNADG